jgi:serine kinase of HPr protein (carbohydrate metabolism regulator)
VAEGADASALVHATAVVLAGRAALIRGPSGSGKSDLALRCLATPLEAIAPEVGSARARLLGDDQLRLVRQGGVLTAEAPATLAGLIEARGLGIVQVPAVAGPVPVALVVDIVAPGTLARLPETEQVTLLGIGLRRLALDAEAPSAPLKLLIALAKF